MTTGGNRNPSELLKDCEIACASHAVLFFEMQ
jgi:hypothetical protein